VPTVSRRSALAVMDEGYRALSGLFAVRTTTCGRSRWRLPEAGPRLATLVGRALAGPGGLFRHAAAHLPDLERYVASFSRRSRSR
jgi:hypothetical protein